MAEPTIPTIEVTTLDVLKVIEQVGLIGRATAPLMAPELTMLFNLWRSATKNGLAAEFERSLQLPFPPKAIHELHGNLEALARHCLDLHAAVQPLLAAHERLHPAKEENHV